MQRIKIAFLSWVVFNVIACIGILTSIVQPRWLDGVDTEHKLALYASMSAIILMIGVWYQARGKKTY